MRCDACGTENETGRKFCGECGMSLAATCSNCGATNPQTVKFCGECGSRLQGEAATTTSEALPVAPASERRLVSVLFADLVGFTAISEARDPEEVRELLSRYFDTCSRIIGRFGGTVEKFIGDAVMAAWGTPIATEDDAERAVRAALDLTAAVTQIGEEIGEPDLRARAGVLTGEAAVTIGAEGQGMVAGDLVNTAARIQSVAEPGAVFVGEATRRTTESAFAYEEAGSFELKGKAGLVPLWRASRVVAGVRGSLKSAGLEPPFVGRDRELRVVKDLFHDSSDERKAHLVSVLGTAGIGKSRLAWEFYKYFDGLAGDTYWHRGRCLAYGDGVTYWALAEMVKMRCRIVEEEDARSALAKLRTTLQEHVPDDEERRWIEPRLAHLLGLEEDAAADKDKEDLFAAWRLFFERLTDTLPVVMVFEDMHWADTSLLDFIEYLHDWSRNSPLFVMTLARPDLTERRPTWGAGKRNFTSMVLEPLDDTDMHALLSGLIEGMAAETEEEILQRAAGVPLYAVETVRMLLDRGLLIQEGTLYRPTGPIATLEVPETLHALIAARLDGLDPNERHLVQDASVLGKTFFKAGIASISGSSEAEIEPVLATLVRKEIISVQADPRSPERGQYGFLQDLLKTVAYETLSKRDRKAKHLAAAAFIERTWEEDDEEVVEVLASHYLRAHEAAPADPDADQIRRRARDLLARAGERAQSLAASAEARRYFEQAAELTEGSLREAELLEQAGRMATREGQFPIAEGHLERAIKVYGSIGEDRRAARAAARLAGEVWMAMGRVDEAVGRLEESYLLLAEGEQDEDLADIAARVGRMHVFAGDLDRAAERTETALQIGEALRLPDVLARALDTKGIVALSKGRSEEAEALSRHAVKVALEHDLTDRAIGATYNLAELLGQRDRYDEARESYIEGLTLARRIGDRPYEWAVLSELAYLAMMGGRWDEAVTIAGEVPLEEPGATEVAVLLPVAIAQIFVGRGAVTEARSFIERFAALRSSSDVQVRSIMGTADTLVLRAGSQLPEAISSAQEALAANLGGPMSQMMKIASVEAVEGALTDGDVETATRYLGEIESLQPGELAPYLAAQADRLRARIAAVGGDITGADRGFRAAADGFRDLGVPYWMAVSLLEHAEVLVQFGRSDQADELLVEASDVFERLKATPWLDRVRAAGTAREAEGASA